MNKSRLLTIAAAAAIALSSIPVCAEEDKGTEDKAKEAAPEQQTVEDQKKK